MYTKKQLKRVVKRAMRQRNSQGRVRRGTKAINLLINTKSHNINPYREGSQIRKLLLNVLLRKTGWRLLRIYLVKSVSISDRPGSHCTFSNQFNHYIVDDMPF